MIVVVWGVSGCGKTTVGSRLAERHRLTFLDADDFHPPENVQKMSAGIPLTDEDRGPWLASIAEVLQAREDQGGVVLACSALKAKYRTTLAVSETVRFVQLFGSFELIASRLAARQHAFMNDALLASQFEALEEDPNGLRLDVSAGIDELCDEIAREVGIV